VTVGVRDARGGRLHAPEAQAVTFVELFFDLVFVFAVTQVTALLAHDLTPQGVLRSILLFWLIWWAWTQFTWTLNPADTTHPVVRLVTLAAAAAAFVMAASVPRAFESDALWFAGPYLVVRALGLWLQVRVDLERVDEDRTGIWRWASTSTVGLAIVLLGAVADPSVRPLVWLAAIGTDLLATALAGGRSWDIHGGHLAERHGLFVIIALGESLIVAATAVAGDERTVELIAAATGAIVVACLLWWLYFGWFKEALEEQLAELGPRDIGSAARDAYSLGHFPLLFGIIGFAVAIEEFGAHPGEPAHAEVIAALGAGVALFVGCSVFAYWRLARRVLVGRLVAVAGMAVGLVATASLTPVWPLAVVAAALLAVVVTEGLRPTRKPDSA
jgi:low temperature requirement protein LtrA